MMEIIKHINSKIERKKFFKTIGFGIVSFAVLKSIPLNLFYKQNKIKGRKINIKINPQAVQRKKGEKNAG